MILSGLALVAAPASAVTGAPWVQSDKDDYPPGGLVTLTGGDWQPGETVHITVDDDQTRSWKREVDVVADESGDIVESFNLPDWFVATYKVLASAPSGTATTGFTDGNVKSTTSPIGVATVTRWQYDGLTCDGAHLTNYPKTGTGTDGVGTGSSLKLEAAPVGTADGQTWNFTGWAGGPFTVLGGDPKLICVSGSSGSVDVTANYSPVPVVSPTVVSMSPSTGTYGGVTSMSATLTRSSNSTAVAGKTVIFTLNGSVVCGGTGQVACPSTNSNGVAMLTNVSLAGINAGTYASGASASFVGDDTFGASTISALLSVAKAPLELQATDTSKTYGDPNPTLSFSVSGLVNGDTRAAALTSDPTVTTTAVATSAVGGYPIELTGGTSSANYDLVRTDGTLTVTKKAVTVTADDKAKSYGDADPKFTYQAPVLSGDSLTGVSCGVSGAHENVGVYDILCVGNTNENYAATYSKGTLTVGAKKVTVTPESHKVTYGDADPMFGYKVTGLSGDGPLDGVSCGVAVDHRNVGEYTIACSGNTNQGYDVTYDNGKLNVEPKPVTVTALDQEKTYGQVDPAFPYEVTPGGLVGSDTLAGTACGVAGDHESAGNYSISCSGNTNANYNVSYAGGTLTITPMGVTVTATSESITYGDLQPTFTYSAPGELKSDPVKGVNCSLDGFAASPSEPATAIRLAAGKYDIVCSGNTNHNYTVNYVDGTLTVNPKPVTVTAINQTKAYGAPDPEFTFAAPDVLVGDSLTGVSCDVPIVHRNAGSYDIVCSENPNPNYSVDFVNGTLTIGAKAITVTAKSYAKTYGEADPSFDFTVNDGGLEADDARTGVTCGVQGAHRNVDDYTIACSGDLSANYDITFVPGKLTITKRPVTVTADAQSKVYGEVDPELSYTVAGTLAFDDKFSGALTRHAGESVAGGPYAITQGTLSLGSNYDLRFVGADLAITERLVTVTADAQSKVYGAVDPELSYKVTSGSVVDGDLFKGLLTRDSGESVAGGPYAINQGSVGLGSNYELTFVPGALTITQRAVEVTADAQSKVYGDVDPELTYGITEGSLAFVDEFSGELTRESGREVGRYAINQGTLSLGSNYELSLVGADLSITERPVTVTADAQSKVYGDVDPELTYKVTTGSVVAGDQFTGALTRDAGEGVAGSPYLIRAGSLDLNANYEFTYVPARFTITKRPITVTADAKSKILGAADPILTYKITAGSMVGDDSTSGKLTREAGEAIGSYKILQGTVDAGDNYSISYVPANLQILFGWDGFLQPINDTAHTGLTQSKFKLGQTIPAKFVIKNAAGQVVQQAGSPTFTRSGQLGSCGPDVSLEAVTSLSADSGSAYKWDGSQYHYNWNTKGLTAGVYRIYANLSDGTARSVDICLTK